MASNFFYELAAHLFVEREGEVHVLRSLGKMEIWNNPWCKMGLDIVLAQQIASSGT